MEQHYLILDRDGVINQDSDQYIKSPEEWIPIPGSLEAIAELKHAGWQIAVATNQSGIARGLFSEETLAAMHQKLHDLLAQLGAQVDLIAYCPHAPDDQCGCRKPRPGLLQQIARRWDIELTGVPFIGDSRKDVEAARAVGCRPILVRTGKGERTLADPAGLEDVEIYPDLAAATRHLLQDAC